MLSAAFIGNELMYVELDPIKLPSLVFKGTDLLALPTLDAVALLEKENAGIRRAQGGSLYFEDIALGMLGFETSSARSIFMWAPAYDHGESLADVAFEIVADDYKRQRLDEWPPTDLLGEDQERRSGLV